MTSERRRQPHLSAPTDCLMQGDRCCGAAAAVQGLGRGPPGPSPLDVVSTLHFPLSALLPFPLSSRLSFPALALSTNRFDTFKRGLRARAAGDAPVNQPWSRQLFARDIYMRISCCHVH